MRDQRFQRKSSSEDQGFERKSSVESLSSLLFILDIQGARVKGSLSVTKFMWVHFLLLVNIAFNSCCCNFISVILLFPAATVCSVSHCFVSAPIAPFGFMSFCQLRRCCCVFFWFCVSAYSAIAAQICF